MEKKAKKENREKKGKRREMQDHQRMTSLLRGRPMRGRLATKRETISLVKESNRHHRGQRISNKNLLQLKMIRRRREHPVQNPNNQVFSHQTLWVKERRRVNHCQSFERRSARD
jgi:hypothetical protein